MSRIEPLSPPYEAEVERQLGAMMPPGVPPIRLFRTFARNFPMTEAMHGWGRYELSRDLSLTLRDREIVIDRTCARCRCEYEWGVHVVFFAAKAGLSTDQIASLTHGGPSDPCWSEQDRLLIEAVDALHDGADVGDDLWGRLAATFSPEQLLDLTMLTGWYHAVSYTANAARLEPEPGAPRFAELRR